MLGRDRMSAGGSVFTADPSRPRAEAVAVRDGRVTAVGSDAEVRGLVGGSTEVVDLRDKMLLPGFQDAHIHSPSGGLDRLRCDLSDLHSRDGYAERLRSYARSRPDAEWILGGGWAMDVFPGGTPTAAELDAVVPDRPAFLPNRDNHGAWVNSRALELAGVTRDTADPADGRVERYGRGDPTGTLHEGAMLLVQRLIPPASAEERERGLLVAQRYLHSLGITAWQDAIVGAYATMPDSLDTYIALAGRGELTARVVGALWFERGRGEEQVEELLAKRAGANVGRFRATSVKIMQDGVCENFTAAVLEPYRDAEGKPTGNTGISFFEAEALKGYVTRLDREGFQVHFHAIGERAVREALDALEAARLSNGPNDNRHHIAHIQVVHPDDVPRFANLGVTANAQPLWASYEPQMVDLTIPFLGPERWTWQYPFGSLARSGARLAFGSDWPVSSPNPLWEIHVAVNRTMFEDYPYADDERARKDPFLPEQRVDLETALTAFTMGSAYVNHLDDRTGSIEVGKLADLVVLDQDLFTVERGAIADAKVLLTLVEGQGVHEAPGL
ncbi:MAG: amidohydrolase [Actinobacteria bacterium]|nr:amidohydrolase [Actinomycetota bacterium]